MASVGPALVVLGACALDRSPELSEASRAKAASTVSVPARTPVDTTDTTTMFGSMPTPVTPAMPMQTGGLQCGGVFCPFARTPIEPCCTVDSDVQAGTARAADLCGLDFSKSAATQYGQYCWQRDQPGVSDTSCPSVTMQAGPEPGCCTDQGDCGAMNTSEMLGCHYQAGTGAQPCGKMDVIDTVHCEPLGVFGVRTTVDVSWGGRSGGLVGLTDDGRAPIVIHLLVTVDSIDDGTNELHGKVQPCGVQLPPFYSTTLCESYKPQFPTTIWESKKLPTIPLSGRYQCLNPGCILTLDPKTELLGIDLTNPEAPWPSPTDTPTLQCMLGMGAACFPDHDNNMLPGVTVTLLTTGMAPMGTGCQGQGYLYQGAPLSSSPAAIFGGVRRADRVLLGTRTKLGGSGKISADCNTGAGSGVAEFVQSRAWGCFVQPGTANFPDAPAGPNVACQAAEAQFLDENLPIYNILAVGQKPDSKLNVVDTSASKGPLFSMVRLGKPGDSVSCEDVRNAAYP
ncbi:MAG: hypothetical protein ACHQ53_01995 [Polyangiales bacterium]